MTIEELLDELAIPHMAEGHEHCREGWIQLDCPYCSPQSEHWRMGYNIHYRYLNCWACGRHKLFETLGLITQLTYRQLKDIVGNLDTDIPSKVHTKPIGTLKLPHGVSDLQLAHVRYLNSRGFKDVDKLKELWELQGIGNHSSFAWRIFIPIHFRGKMVSYTTRSIDDRVRLRYRSANAIHELVPHKTLLYGADYVRHTAIVVEGPIDVWKIGPGAVATFGTGYSQQQVAKIAQFPRRIICFDNEPKAQDQAEELCDQLEGLPGETVNVVLDAKDAGESTNKEIQRLRKLFL